MYCTKCGYKVNKKDEFCINCGNKLDTEEIIKSEEVTEVIINEEKIEEHNNENNTFLYEQREDYDEEKSVDNKYEKSEKLDIEEISKKIVSKTSSTVNSIGNESKRNFENVFVKIKEFRKIKPNTFKVMLGSSLLIITSLILLTVLFRSTPEKTVNRFFEGISEGDSKKALLCTNYSEVMDTELGYSVNNSYKGDLYNEKKFIEMQELLDENFKDIFLIVDDINEKYKVSKVAKVTVNYKIFDGTDVYYYDTDVDLFKKNGKWIIDMNTLELEN